MSSVTLFSKLAIVPSFSILLDETMIVTLAGAGSNDGGQEAYGAAAHLSLVNAHYIGRGTTEQRIED